MASLPGTQRTQEPFRGKGKEKGRRSKREPWAERPQADLPKCQTSYIESVIQGNGIAAAYCNDRYFVLVSDGGAGGVFEYNLDDIPQPPGGSQPNDAADGSFSAGDACVTGMASLTAGKVVRRLCCPSTARCTELGQLPLLFLWLEAGRQTLQSRQWVCSSVDQ
jgi:hypothetical protein